MGIFNNIGKDRRKVGDIAVFVDFWNPALIKIKEKSFERDRERGDLFPHYYCSGIGIPLIRDDEVWGRDKFRFFYFDDERAFDSEGKIVSSPMKSCRESQLYLPEEWVRADVLAKAMLYFAKR